MLSISFYSLAQLFCSSLFLPSNLVILARSYAIRSSEHIAHLDSSLVWKFSIWNSNNLSSLFWWISSLSSLAKSTRSAFFIFSYMPLIISSFLASLFSSYFLAILGVASSICLTYLLILLQWIISSWSRDNKKCTIDTLLQYTFQQGNIFIDRAQVNFYLVPAPTNLDQVLIILVDLFLYFLNLGFEFS